jgi:hypothetical protein
MLSISASPSTSAKLQFRLPHKPQIGSIQRGSVQGHIRHAVAQSGEQSVAQPPQIVPASAGISSRHMTVGPRQSRQCRGRSASRCGGRIPGGRHRFATSSRTWGFRLRTYKRSNAFGTVDLVSREAHQVDLQLFDVHRNLCPPPAWRRCAARRSRCLQIRPISASGWSTPISLLANITDTRHGVVADRHRPIDPGPACLSPPPRGDARSSGSLRTRSRASLVNGSKTARCSVTTLMMCWPRRRERSQTPRIARLLLSVAPLVKMISRGAAFSAAAIEFAGGVHRVFGGPSERMAGARLRCRSGP